MKFEAKNTTFTFKNIALLNYTPTHTYTHKTSNIKQCIQVVESTNKAD